MAIGGAPIGYNVNAPANTDSAGLGDDELRSLKTNLQGGLDSEHNWPAAGGAAVGYHRYGSARPYLAAAASAVSSDGTDARVVLNVGDGSLWGTRSATSIELLGHPGILINSITSFTVPNKFATVVQGGKGNTAGGSPSGTTRVTFSGSGYSGAPLVIVCSELNGYSAGVFQSSSGQTGFVAFGNDNNGGGAAVNFNWLSIGTVSLGVT